METLSLEEVNIDKVNQYIHIIHLFPTTSKDIDQLCRTVAFYHNRHFLSTTIRQWTFCFYLNPTMHRKRFLIICFPNLKIKLVIRRENKIPEVVSSGSTVKRKCGKDKIDSVYK